MMWARASRLSVSSPTAVKVPVVEILPGNLKTALLASAYISVTLYWPYLPPICFQSALNWVVLPSSLG